MSKKYLLSSLWAVLCGAVCAAAVRAESAPVSVGAILMLTGDQAVYGNAMREGIEIASEEINNAGGVGGQKLKVLFEDSQLKPQEANTAAMRLLDREKIVAALDASFIEVMANGPMFESKKVPVISLWDSSEEIEKLGDYIFGIGIWTPSSANVAAEFSYHKLGARKAAIVNLQAEWSESVAKLYAAKFEELGGKVVKVFSLLPSSADFRTVLLQVKALEPDVLYSPLTENIVPFYTQLREQQLPMPVVTSDIIADEHIQSKPRAFEGIYQTNAPDPESPAAKFLSERYLQKYGRAAKLPLFVAWGYDGLHLLGLAINAVGPEPEKIKEYLYSVKSYPGASGTISFDAKGSSPMMERMYKIQDGKFELAE